MAFPSPILDLHLAAQAPLAEYGSPIDGRKIEIVQAIEPVEIEYASLRRHAALMDRPERGLVEVRGSDRVDFLNRMLTQELIEKRGSDEGKRLEVGRSCNSFRLSRKGRIDADIRLMRMKDSILMDMDVHCVRRLLIGENSQKGVKKGDVGGLGSYVLSEDVVLTDVTQRFHRLSLHGPRAREVLAAVSRPVQDRMGEDLKEGEVCEVWIDEVPVIVDRWDSAGEIGLELVVPIEGVRTVYERLSLSAVGTHQAGAESVVAPAKRIGWHAYNIARIEAGTALFNLDFGVNTLPHETGRETLQDRVSFRKGCYLGQEVVARMESLGHPKQRLVGLRIEEARGRAPWDIQTGCEVVEADAPNAEVVGAITSAALSPMLGSAHIAFAMMKWSHSGEGKRVWVRVEGRRCEAVVCESLRFWAKE